MPRTVKPTDKRQKNRWVRFRIMDVYIPDPRHLLMKLHGHDILRGRVIDLSDNGTDVFMVIDVEGLDEPVIVPAGRIMDSV
jgi:hypothetical protein